MIPKVELHNHLEGTATPALVRKLAKRNNINIPESIFASETTFAWRDFLHFLEVYEMASGVIRNPQDYRDVTYDYLARCAGEGVIYTELFSSPDHAALAGMSYVEHLEGTLQGISDAKRDFGIESRILIACVRHYGVESCLNVVQEAIAHPHPLVVGIGLAGDEMHFPPKLFEKVFALAADAGLACTAHAGEMVGPEGVWEAINSLPITRVGHGVRSIEDPDLVKELVARDITLEVCPGSNIALGVYPDFASHSFLALKEAGVKMTLNSDDPPYFNTTIGQEYAIAKHHFGLSDAQLRELTRNGIRASFASAATKAELMAKVGEERG